VEIQKQLTDTQSELDSETTQRKILTNETEKVAVEISFRVERRNASMGGFAQIWNALRESGSILGDSTASLITTIIAIIPWLVLVVPLTWLLRKAWKLGKSGSSVEKASRLHHQLPESPEYKSWLNALTAEVPTKIPHFR
jgi:hypothetical protein